MLLHLLDSSSYLWSQTVQRQCLWHIHLRAALMSSLRQLILSSSWHSRHDLKSPYHLGHTALNWFHFVKGVV